MADWPGWASLGGNFTTGAGVIRWLDDHVEIFATDAMGTAWHNWTAAGHGAWQGWQTLPGGPLATRPFPRAGTTATSSCSREKTTICTRDISTPKRAGSRSQY